MEGSGGGGGADTQRPCQAHRRRLPAASPLQNELKASQYEFESMLGRREVQFASRSETRSRSAMFSPSTLTTEDNSAVVV